MKRFMALMLLLVMGVSLCVSARAENLDSYFTARFNKSPKFYTGPGSDYYRANNGKAQYGGGGVARVYGYEGSWLLLGYETGAGVYRIGYFEKKYLNNMTVEKGNGNVRQLYFEYRNAWIVNTCQITDDPVMKQTPFATLQRGQSCSYLASMGSEWAYIELTLPSEKKKARGFVPIRSVTFSPISGNSSDDSYIPGSNTGSANGFFSGGTWATASAPLATYSGPSYYDTNTGTYYIQDQAVYCLAKHYDAGSGWWVLCRIQGVSGAQYIWTLSNNFYNASWLLGRLAQE